MAGSLADNTCQRTADIHREDADKMRASRLLSIQMLLETRGRMSARALAEAL
jgi:hypothetical protein